MRIRQLFTCSWPYLIFLLVALVFLSPQLISHVTLVGSDGLFHMNRFYDTAKQIQAGHFNLFQSNFGFEQSGRVINAVYGPLFAYLNGLILAITQSWFGYEIISDLILFMLAVCGMYQVTKQVKAPQWAGIMITIAFMGAGWMTRWMQYQNMTAWGAALAPFAVVQAIRLHENPDDGIKIWPLALTMTVIMQIHVLSTIFFTVMLVPFFIDAWIRSHRKRHLWGQLLKSIGLTIIFTTNVWLNFLVLYSKNQIANPGAFVLSKNVLHLGIHLASRGTLSYLMIIMIFITIMLTAWQWRRSHDHLGLWLVINGLVWLFLATNLFPWRWFDQNLPQLQSSLQFPYRLTIIAYPLLFAGLARSLSYLNNSHRAWRVIAQVVLIVATFMAAGAVVNHTRHRCIIAQHKGLTSWTNTVSIVGYNQHLIKNYINSDHPGSLFLIIDKRHPDYLPVKYKLKGKQQYRAVTYQATIINHFRDFNHQVTKNGQLQISWQQNQAGKIQLPLITYQQSQLKLNGKKIGYQVNQIGVPTITAPAGHNTITLSFKLPFYYYPLLIVWGLSILFTLIWQIYRNAKRIR